MATVVPNNSILEISSNNNTAIGVSIPFNGNAVFNPTFSTRDQIKSNLINYVLTNRNERVFNNGFGANLQSLLFNNTNSSLDSLSEMLLDDIQQNFPQLSIKQVKLSNDFDNNTIKFEMFYSFGPRLSSLDVDEALNININLTEAVATNAVKY